MYKYYLKVLKKVIKIKKCCRYKVQTYLWSQSNHVLFCKVRLFGYGWSLPKSSPTVIYYDTQAPWSIGMYERQKGMGKLWQHMKLATYDLLSVRIAQDLAVTEGFVNMLWVFAGLSMCRHFIPAKIFFYYSQDRFSFSIHFLFYLAIDSNPFKMQVQILSMHSVPSCPGTVTS